MPKFFVKSEQIKDIYIFIQGEDVNHIINVLRMKNGEQLNICNSDSGVNYIAQIDSYQKEYVKCKIVEQLDSTTESNVNITIFQGLPKFDKMELIIQKATEIGAKSIVPVAMKRSIVKLNDKDLSKKLERWRKIAQIAAKQSMRDYIPQIEGLLKPKDIVKLFNVFDLILIAYENEKDNTLKEELLKIKNKEDSYSIGIIIGPEGGIDEEEINLFMEKDNVRKITLGKRILRTETAGLVMASNILYELEN